MTARLSLRPRSDPKPKSEVPTRWAQDDAEDYEEGAARWEGPTNRTTVSMAKRARPFCSIGSQVEAMKTVAELLSERGAELLSLLEILLREHSSLYLWNPPGSGIVHVSGDHAYRELDAQGKQLQSRLLEEYTEFADLVAVLLKAQPEKVRKSHDKHRKTILAAITQEGSTWHQSIDQGWASASNALRSQMASVENLYSASAEGAVVVVPDINALLWNPRLEEWSFTEITSFEMCLVPVVPK